MRRVLASKVPQAQLYSHGSTLTQGLAEYASHDTPFCDVPGLCQVAMKSPPTLELRLKLDPALLCGDAQWDLILSEPGAPTGDLQVLRKAYKECLVFWKSVVVRFGLKDEPKRLDATLKRFVREAPHVVEWHRRTCAGPDECAAWYRAYQKSVEECSLPAQSEICAAIRAIGNFYGLSLLTKVDESVTASPLLSFFVAVVGSHYPPGRLPPSPGKAEEEGAWRGQPREGPAAWHTVPHAAVSQLAHLLVHELRLCDPPFVFADQHFWPRDFSPPQPPQPPPSPKVKKPRRRRRNKKAVSEGPAEEAGSADETAPSLAQEDSAQQPSSEPVGASSEEQKDGPEGVSVGEPLSAYQPVDPSPSGPSEGRGPWTAEEAETEPWALAGDSVRLRRLAHRLRDQRLLSHRL